MVLTPYQTTYNQTIAAQFIRRFVLNKYNFDVEDSSYKRCARYRQAIADAVFIAAYHFSIQYEIIEQAYGVSFRTVRTYTEKMMYGSDTFPWMKKKFDLYIKEIQILLPSELNVRLRSS